MRHALTLQDALQSGPGHDGYAYCAAVYCIDCGKQIIRDVFAENNNRPIESPLSQDSETLPQPIFFGESDRAQHCDECGAYLYGEIEAMPELIEARDVATNRRPDGSYECATMKDGYRVWRVYYGYSKAEAVQEFLADVNTSEEN